MNELTPWRRGRVAERQHHARRDFHLSPFVALRREMDRLFDDTFAGFGIGAFGERAVVFPNVEVTERDRDVLVTAELPGLDDKDIEIRVEDGALVLSGEKRHEVDDEDRRYSERYYGRFERRLSLPADVDDDRAEPRFHNGVLTVTLPKTKAGRAEKKRIPIAR